jgi:hypothetical protein
VSANEWTAVVGLAVAIVGALYGTTRFMVKSIMAELQPNSGNSLKDQVSRIEVRLDQLMLELNKKALATRPKLRLILDLVRLLLHSVIRERSTVAL